MRCATSSRRRPAIETSTELDAVREPRPTRWPRSPGSPASGPALTITLDDSPDAPHDGPPPDGLSLDDFVVHQQDIEAVVNALWAGGAEAMTIMDQRVIGTSAVRCVGSVLSLHGRTYSPPYAITAIGDPERAPATRWTGPPAVSIYREYARELGLGYDVSDRARTPRCPRTRDRCRCNGRRPAEWRRSESATRQ